MPFGRILPEENPEYNQLLERLRSEWEQPQQNVSGPVIIPDSNSGRTGRSETYPSRLYVIWDAWGSLSQRERSEMIMDVYETVRGSNFASHITVAIGVTPEEAERMKLRYTTAGVVV